MATLLWGRFVFLILAGILVVSYGVAAWRTRDER
jgi:hypothetical protein